MSANELFALGKYAEATSAYNTILAEDPRNVVALVNRAATYSARGLHRKCIADCDVAVKMDASYLRSYIVKADALSARGKLPKAAAAIEVGIKSGGSSGDVLQFSELMKRREAIAAKLKEQAKAEAKASSPSPAPASSPSPAPSSARAAKPRSAATKQKQPTTPEAPRVEELPDDYEEPPKPAAPAQGSPGGKSKSKSRSRGGKAKSKKAKAKGESKSGSTAPRPSVLDELKKDVDPGTLLATQRVMTGHALVNAGKHKDAIKMFSEILRSHPRLIEARLGRGTAYALSAKYHEALEDFNVAVDTDPSHIDARKRRAQVLNVLGRKQEAMLDLNMAVEKGTTAPGGKMDVDGYAQRGQIQYNNKHYGAALKDFEEALKEDPNNVKQLYDKGTCLEKLGRMEESIATLKRALELNPEAKDIWVSLGQTYRSWGDSVNAEKSFTRALELDPVHRNGLHLRGLLYHGQGYTSKALRDVGKGLILEPEDTHCVFMTAIAFHTLGRFDEAIARYNQLFRIEENHLGFCQRDWGIHQRNRLDTPLLSFNFDNILTGSFKESFAKRKGKTDMPEGYRSPALKRLVQEVKIAKNPKSPEIAAIVDAARELGTYLQYDSPGFLANRRQQRQFGIAAVQLAQMFTTHITEPGGLKIPDAASSMRPEKLPACDLKGFHVARWRDIYDMVTVWRQLSEPFDPVWWIDRLTYAAFSEGFGLQTPMVTGENRVPRYYPYFKPALEITKRLISEQCPLTDRMRDRIMASKTCKEVYKVMKRDFWVVNPCESVVVPGRVMEGTRLTITASEPVGHEFTIRMPGTPKRWDHFEEELQGLWEQLTEVMRSESEDQRSRAADLILSMYYYWVNMGPLTRGSAAVGLAVVVGLSLACDLPLTLPLPKLIQIDWEGILRPNPKEFIAFIKPIVYSFDGARPPSRFVKSWRELPQVDEHISTVRDVFEVMNIDEDFIPESL